MTTAPDTIEGLRADRDAWRAVAEDAIGKLGDEILAVDMMRRRYVLAEKRANEATDHAIAMQRSGDKLASVNKSLLAMVSA